MKVLHVNTQDGGNGSAIAARRLHKGLMKAGVDSFMAVAVQRDDTPNTFPIGSMLFRYVGRQTLMVMERNVLPRFWRRPPNKAFTSFSLFPSFQFRHINRFQKDIVNLHWLGDGFLSPWDIGRLQGPVVWSLHDTWPFTGGCHFTNKGCTRFTGQCGACPELGSHTERDLSRLHWLLKHKAIQKINPYIVVPSTTIMKSVQQSSLLGSCRIRHIPNAVDTRVFRPIAKALAREVLGLPAEGLLVLFGALSSTSDYNKGYDLLRAAMEEVTQESKQAFSALVFGASHGDSSPAYPTHFLGKLSDETTLALAYSAADIFVCPSRQEAFSNTVLEAMACGTPAVAFPVGGIPDMIEHQEHGWLAKTADPDSLAQGISTLLNDETLRLSMGAKAREKVVQQYDSQRIAEEYIKLYTDVLQS